VPLGDEKKKEGPGARPTSFTNEKRAKRSTLKKLRFIFGKAVSSTQDRKEKRKRAILYFRRMLRRRLPKGKSIGTILLS